MFVSSTIRNKEMYIQPVLKDALRRIIVSSALLKAPLSLNCREEQVNRSGQLLFPI